MNTKTEPFGNLVYQGRKSLGLTQNELAERIGIEASTISRIENGTRKKLGYQLVFKLKTSLQISEPKDGFKF
ncbi:helix-turn-helix domain-containing protein [Proteiniclasticum sp. SCR006]|uniref:Helix-turn-helix domain-containing protein n=1 Tax=Proteiniclasticum aestuarii TaxID=2817862 RepID=A0A939H9L2_9CLOT|nr:helix-turn-helix transcriptional regulator [Proteiniclasticum aestuarii]MBO1264483.1 helix-turn-helix domain-containing protein [Proteiniclasticum aestuarii]